jgi:hypothetical protein
MGWGEGLNEAADFLNRQPDIKSSHVAAEGACQMINPFLIGNVSCLDSSAEDSMVADYVIYYYTISQRNLCDPAQRDYYSLHQQPIHRVTLHDLDYVRIYRNPIQNRIDREANSLSQVFRTFGYNLTADGQLSLFWQNLRFSQFNHIVDLVPIGGETPAKRTALEVQSRWAECRIKPEFVADMKKPKAIIESLCPLSAAVLRPGFYQAKLAIQDKSGIVPLESCQLGVLKVDADGRFEVEIPK